MDVNILIQRLQQGEAIKSVTAEGQEYLERRPPTATALQAARALQQLIQLHDSNMRVIQQLTKDNESLHEQIKPIQSSVSSEQTS